MHNTIEQTQRPLSPFNYIFQGDQPFRSTKTIEKLLRYPLRSIRTNPSIFIQGVEEAYNIEKSGLSNHEKNSEIDLKKPESLKKIAHHVRVHSITGLPHWGASTTESIPYWDRQALIECHKYQHPINHKEEIEALDLENINCLRAFISIIAPKYIEARESKLQLEKKLKGKQVTHRDLSYEFEIRLNSWETICDDYYRVLVAKIKHLIFLADKIESLGGRKLILKEVNDIIAKTNISPSDLSINMGVDGGLSEATYRPAFIIQGFTQLKHLGVTDISIPHNDCPTWSLETCKESLLRESENNSLLTEPDCFKLPWTF